MLDIKDTKEYEDKVDEAFCFELIQGDSHCLCVIRPDSDELGKGVPKDMRQIARPAYIKAFVREAIIQDRTKLIEEVITMIEVEMPTEDEIDDNDEGERYVAPVLERIQEALSKLK
jgi:hypothetical protein